MHRAVAKKKILAQEMGQKKNSGRLKIPHPPHHFSNGPSLKEIRISEQYNVGTSVVYLTKLRCNCRAQHCNGQNDAKL